MARPPAVIDTNVVVGGLLADEAEAATCRSLHAMLAGRFFYLLSEAPLAEYRRVLLRPRIHALHGLSGDEVDTILLEIAANGGVRIPSSTPECSPDPGDQHLWDLAAAEPGVVLVTGEGKLLERPPAFARLAAFAQPWGPAWGARSPLVQEQGLVPGRGGQPPGHPP